MRRKILVITTGGTIASVKTPYGLIPGLTSQELISYLPGVGEDIYLDTLALLNLDSTDMTPDNWLQLARAVEEHYSDYDGFVIAHGTDTMAYTAAALSYLIRNSAKPIVLTGAQRPIGSEITDAKTNLRDAILYASDWDSHGVQIVFGGDVIIGTRAKKIKTQSFAAFGSINYPNLASIQNDRIIRFIEPVYPRGGVQFSHELNQRVFLWKLTPGVSPALVPEIFKAYDVIILESFGVGGIPDSIEEALFRELSSYRPEEKVLVMSTQVQYEGSSLDTYEVGRTLSERFSVLEARDMTLEAVLTKLMWIMADKGQSWDTIRSRFYTPIARDSLYR